MRRIMAGRGKEKPSIDFGRNIRTCGPFHHLTYGRPSPPETLTCLTIPLLRTGAGAGAAAAGAALISFLEGAKSPSFGVHTRTSLLVFQQGGTLRTLFLHRFPL